jgi:hypothetical protein
MHPLTLSTNAELLPTDCPIEPAISQRPARPYDKDELVGILQFNLSSMRQLTRSVRERGVDFHINQTVEKELRDVGAYDSLIEAIAATYRISSELPSETSSSAQYFQLLRDSVDYLKKKQVLDAAQILEHAIKLNPDMSTAYQYLGAVQLYLFHTIKGRDLKADRAAAEANMRKAIERGGEAMFVVKHNHLGSSPCLGFFVVRKSSIAYQVVFKFLSSEHSFDVEKPAIKEIESAPDAFRITVPNPNKPGETKRFLFVASDDFFSSYYPKLIKTLIKEYQ